VKIPCGKNQLRTFIGLVALLLAATGLQAQLTLTIDTTTKTWWWTGSATVSGPLSDPTAARITGGNGADPTYQIGSGHLDFSSTLNNIEPEEDVFWVGPDGFYINVRTWYPPEYNGTFTGQGSSSPNYYGDQSAEVIGYLAGWNGMTVYVFETTVGTVSVIATPVPEPSTYALAFGVAALGCVIIRRQRSSRSAAR
jgi:hypothetical protein